MRSKFLSLILCFTAIAWACSHAIAALTVDQWESETLPIKLEVGYAVRALDLSGDGKLDIAIVDSKRILWLENPTWTAHVIYATPDAKNDNVCFAPHDIDGDGVIDFAIGHDWQPNNSKTGGLIGWIQSPKDPRNPWSYFKIGEMPTTHRMNWVDINQDGKQELIVAPLKGRDSAAPGFDQTPVELLSFSIPNQPKADTWSKSVLHDETHVMHNFQAIDMDGDRTMDLLLASYEGVTWLKFDSTGRKFVRPLGKGYQGTAPRRGSSEVRLGTFADGKQFVGTIEPWHGDEVVVYTRATEKPARFWERTVLDNELKWGHAVACANLDDDADEEMVVGVRDNANDPHRCGIRIYDPTPSGWNRLLVAPGEVAVEDMIVADLNGDGKNDIVAVGRATHNAVIYWNRGKANTSESK